MTQPGNDSIFGPATADLEFTGLTTGLPLAATLTDTGNGHRFVTVLGGRVRYAHDTRQWYVWDGHRLRKDPGTRTGRVFAMTEDVIQSIRLEVEQATDPDDQARLVAFAGRSSSVPARQAMMIAGAVHPPIAITSDQLDANPLLLGAQNGVYDMQEMVFRPGEIDDLVTRQVATWHDKDAEAPRWLAHVEHITGGKKHVAEYLQKAMGYTLTGLVSEQAFWFLHGPGGTGKNALVETLMHLMGEYAAPASARLLYGAVNDHTTEVASLRGLRMVLADELSAKKHLAEHRLKMLAGGTKITARGIARDDITFFNFTKLWLLSNPKPPIPAGLDDGIWRRLKSLFVDGIIPAEMRDINFQEKLREEWPGILNWLLDGYRMWYDAHVANNGGTGLADIPEILQDVAEYQAEEDTFGQWLDDCCELKMGSREYVHVLYISYVNWCEGQGIDNPLVAGHFGRELTTRSIGTATDRPVLNGKKTRVRTGIELRVLPTGLSRPLMELD